MKNKELQKTAMQGFDNIYDSLYKISKQWETDMIPIILIEEHAKIIKSKLTDNKNEKINIFIKQYRQVIDQLVKTCKSKSFETGINSVHIDFIKKCIDVIKENFSKGMSE